MTNTGRGRAPERVLVVMLADAGDLLLATPALRAVRSTYPRAHVVLLTKPSSCAVLAGQGFVDEVVPFDKHLFDRPSALLQPAALFAALRFLWALWQRRCDTALLLHHLTLGFGAAKFAGVLLASGARVRAGLDNGRGWFLTMRAADLGFGPRHQVDYWLDVAALIGARPAPADTRLPAYQIPAAAREDLAMLLARHGAAFPASPAMEGSHGSPDGPPAGEPALPLLILHPGSGAYSTARRWPAERFAAVARDLTEREGLQCLVVGGPDDMPVAEAVAALVPGARCLAGQTSWPVLAALLGSARLVVANDGGVAHLAAAVGAPLVAIFGPSNERAWRPLGERTRVVRAWLPCVPCFYRGHGLGNPAGCPPRTCLQLVTPAMVLAEARALLAEE
jgi:heptosyltransferase-2